MATQSSDMASRRVLLVGCGVAGPVMALFLKQKGYVPIVLEKVRQLGDAGASLMLMPNGMKVFSLVGMDSTISATAPHLGELCDQSYTGQTIGVSYIPQKWTQQYSQPAAGIKRTALNLALKEALIENDIAVHEGWKLKSIEQTETSVTAISEDGQRIEGSFLVGCDGIKAVSRNILLASNGVKEQSATYTGLIQTAGMSPTPAFLKNRPGLLNVYGPGAHLIVYPVTSEISSWAITQRDPTEAQETWRIYAPEERKAQQEELLANFKSWASPVPELIKGAERIIKYGLYDRPELSPEQWYSGRCVLIGDAAHPTSPHLGQGANQALEDCYHLSQMLPSFDASPISRADLTKIFHDFATKRQPRTAFLVKGARSQGERRVVDGGLQACEERDEILRKGWEDEAGVAKKFDYLFREPFTA